MGQTCEGRFQPTVKKRRAVDSRTDEDDELALVKRGVCEAD